jgi:hypothetical protein
MRRCKCGCGELVEGRFDYRPKHRQRAWRQRVEQEAKAKGVSAHPTLGELRAMPNPSTRIRDAPAAGSGAQARPGGLQVSYYRAFNTFTALTGLDDHEIERALRAALSDRQRAELERRTG